MTDKITKMIKQYSAARRVGTPLIAISCFDPEATMRSIQRECIAEPGKKAYLDHDKDTALIQWDIIRGWYARNKKGEGAITAALGKDHSQDETMSPVAHLEYAANFPEDTVLFLLNGHFYFEKPDFIQALWNLRDVNKEKGNTVVLLSPHFELPSEIANDILLIEEELPTDEDLRGIIQSTLGDAGLDKKVKPDDIELAIDAVRGLAAFPAEQAVAMSLTTAGIHINDLWDRKRALISQAPGLSVYKDDFNFDKIGGLEAIKQKFRRIINGKATPKVIVFIDEIEKAMAGAGSDSSGTSQDQLGVLLSEMQDRKYSGSLFIGPPGAAKSAFAKSVAAEAGILTIRMDLGDMKGSLVGESEKRIRQAMKVVQAVAGDGGAFFIATSNDIRVVKPELKRRFKKGIWFFDLPSAEERQAIWKIHCEKFGIEYHPDRIGFDEGWTGAEIENCVAAAWEEDITLEEASKSIVPVCISGKEDIMRLRQEANNRYSSASDVGVYQMPVTSVAATKTASNSRKMNLGNN